jgi:hypothetical protein
MFSGPNSTQLNGTAYLNKGQAVPLIRQSQHLQGNTFPLVLLQFIHLLLSLQLYCVRASL